MKHMITPTNQGYHTQSIMIYSLRRQVQLREVDVRARRDAK